ncbi:hypothetical protein EWF20_10530 [Sulfolobus sp. S-194]|uniref:hypothetical protein n=1 Tax=Sulfolobus sp. S-194 TaxID=2512240 RepID=UPI00143707AC|nr:hypothetical protein [Sulfolobus sp. S-194]QIW24529.1 hypothetical protein EWF20_10530 [Sulfolobus sp. S-194]
MKFSEKANIQVVFGDGQFERSIIMNTLERNKDKYCETSLFIPESGRKGKGRTINTGIDGVLKFIKDDVTRFSLSYIIFIDKEHCTSDYESCISRYASKYGILISSIQKIREDFDVYRLMCNVGDKKFFIYFVFLGFYCCIEDFILIKICNKDVSKFRGEGCCRKYKEILNHIQKEAKESCIEKTYDQLFRVIAIILEDLTTIKT